MKKIILIMITLIGTRAFSTPDALIEEIRSKYNIVEGSYKLKNGSASDCVEGEYQIFKGKAGVVSLKAADGLMAKHIHGEAVNFRENNCSMNYTTTAAINGFRNIEAVNCANSKVSYTRTFEAKFLNKQLEYKLSSHRIIENIKSEVNCLLELVED